MNSNISPQERLGVEKAGESLRDLKEAVFLHQLGISPYGPSNYYGSPVLL